MHVSPAKRSFGKCDRRTDRVIPMCRYALQATQKQVHELQLNMEIGKNCFGHYQVDHMKILVNVLLHMPQIMKSMKCEQKI